MNDTSNEVDKTMEAKPMAAEKTSMEAPKASEGKTPLPSAAKAKSGSNKVVFIIIAVIVACCVISALAFAGFVGLGMLANSESSIEESDDNEIGETKTVDDWEVTLEGVSTKGDSYIVELTAKNNSDSDQIFSTLLQMDLQNGDGENYSLDLALEVREDEILDGTVKANGTRTGKMGYKVDDNPEEIVLVVKGDLLSDEEVEFKIK